ncbi:MAG: aldehyde dehydrogenase [Phycisphaerales bacterium]
MEHFRNFIDGEFREASSGATLDVHEPASGAVYAQVARSNAHDVNIAVKSASEAFPEWSGMGAAERSKRMLALAQAIEDDLDRFANAESVDTGKPIALAKSVDIPRAVANLRFFATAILHTESQAHPMDSTPAGGTALNYTLRAPRGVAGLISPWNLPLYLLTWKIAPAIATGNTCVAKPSEVTPATATLMAEKLNGAGIPKGVVNILHGLGDECGAEIVKHKDVAAVSFTGSTKVGEWIGEHCGRALKPVSLELGGKNPTIVFDDADMGEALPTSVRAAFANQGQICLCGSRLLVQSGVYDEFVRDFVERTKAIAIGDPLNTATQHGASVSAPHLAKIEAAVDRARELGGEVLTGGRRFPTGSLPDRCKGGYFYEPTAIAGLANDCDVVQDEIFGPVVTIQRFETEDEALTLANSTAYGLASNVWTSDLTRAHRVASRLESGIVWVNCWMLRDLRTPFGGMKASGVGREGGNEALRFFTEAKNVCVSIKP